MLKLVRPVARTLNNTPVTPKIRWSILDQTKDAFKQSGKSGVVIFVEPDDVYKAKLCMFLIKHGIQYDRTGNAYLAFEHSAQAKALYQRLIDAGLKGELVIAP